MSQSLDVPAGCVSVVMPCFNERATIEQVLARVLAQPEVGEVIVVDDGSTDGTREILRGVHDPRVLVFEQPRNMGKGAALQRAFLEVARPYVVIQDADLEYDPAEYPRLLDPLVHRGADVVYGSRFAPSEPSRVLYYWHSVGNKLLTTLSNMSTDLNLTDMETCFKAFRREVLAGIELEEDRFGIEPELTAKIAAGRWVVWEVGISYAGRTYDEGKKIGLKDAVRAAYCIGRYSKVGERLARSPAYRRRDEPVPADDLRQGLEHLAEAARYADYLVDHIEPWVTGVVHEVGAGRGTIAGRLLDRGHEVIASEPDGALAAQLEQALSMHPGSRVVHGSLAEAIDTEKADTVVLANVLEHIVDDIGALRAIHAALPSGGRVVLLVPAHRALYSEFDRMIGHHRRYRRTDLVNRLAAAGFEVDDVSYVNALGAVLWWGYARVLRRVPTAKGPSSLFDRFLTPVVSVIDRAVPELPMGQTLVAVGSKR